MSAFTDPTHQQQCILGKHTNTLSFTNQYLICVDLTHILKFEALLYSKFVSPSEATDSS